jgi:beta-phosphoglucomutase
MTDKIESAGELKQKILKAKALFFDLDGTLIDTDYSNFLSYKKAIEQVKKSPINLIVNRDKRITRRNIRAFVPDLNDEEYDKVIEIKEKLYSSNLHVTELNGAVADMLDEYSDKKLILVTNGRQERADLLLNHFYLSDKFTRKYYRENMTSDNKYQDAISSLCIDADLIFVFENDESEIAAAVAAGIPSENILKVA